MSAWKFVFQLRWSSWKKLCKKARAHEKNVCIIRLWAQMWYLEAAEWKRTKTVTQWMSKVMKNKILITNRPFLSVKIKPFSPKKMLTTPKVIKVGKYVGYSDERETLQKMYDSKIVKQKNLSNNPSNLHHKKYRRTSCSWEVLWTGILVKGIEIRRKFWNLEFENFHPLEQ